MFERGYLKYALLELLQESPKHGYEMMKDLEDRMGGFYAPSAGAIYPTLQLLEDRGWVTVETVDGKKVYTITEAGRQAVAENTQRTEARGPQRGPFGPGAHEHEHEHGHEHQHQHGPHEGPHGGPRGSHGPWAWGERGRGGPGFGFDWRGQPEARALAHEVHEVGRLMLFAGMQSVGRPEQLGQLKQIIERTRKDLEGFLAQSERAGRGGTQPSDSGEGATLGSDDPIDIV